MKILNLYAGIGGNRKLWGDEHEITAVENDEQIASEYQKNFPKDTVIVGDAKEYLLEHFQEFDFIWASPPCPSHSRMRTLWKSSGEGSGKTSGQSFKLPDMDLYSLIIFLQHFYNGQWIVENVISYYEPLIRPTVIDNHYFWSSRPLIAMKAKSRLILSQDLDKKAKQLGIPIPPKSYPTRFRRKMINNCVKPKVGKHVFDCLFKSQQVTLN